MVEVREVLRGWLDGVGLRTVAARAGVDRKTARRYVEAAQAVGLSRDGGVEGLSDELVGVVVGAVRPARPNGHGAAWETLLAHEEQVRAWLAAPDKLSVEHEGGWQSCRPLGGAGDGAMWSAQAYSGWWSDSCQGPLGSAGVRTEAGRPARGTSAFLARRIMIRRLQRGW